MTLAPVRRDGLYNLSPFPPSPSTAYGSDIIIPLDELHPYHIDRDALIKCVLRSHRWEARSLTEHLKDVKQQAMYAVIHGGVDP